MVKRTNRGVGQVNWLKSLKKRTVVYGVVLAVAVAVGISQPELIATGVSEVYCNIVSCE